MLSIDKLHQLIKKKKNSPKVEPELKHQLSLDNLTSLVSRLSLQVDDLGKHWADKQETVINPWDGNVTVHYQAILHQLEQPICTNKCCHPVHPTVQCVEDIPWPSSVDGSDRLEDRQYFYWCVLMRCLPWMDSATSHYVKSIGTYAMRDILQKKEALLPLPFIEEKKPKWTKKVNTWFHSNDHF
ncbi:hypothetical protein BDB01DRAFT_852622 [Pilobolus umbonatus]|nr:hypothetical protein BDB01DRAFT_852622 [Pilobolus umbonatus]